MSGQKDGVSQAGRQPGGRPPAPGELAIVQAFVNTHFDLGTDHGSEVLASPPALARWLSTHDLLLAGPGRPGSAESGSIGSSELAAALSLRERLRELAAAQDGEHSVPHDPAARARQALDSLAAVHQVQLRFGATGPRLVPVGGATAFSQALAQILAITAAAMLDGRWSRIKVCPGRHCGWMFYDRSRNRSGRWCAMSVCGGREKARAHYERSRGS